MGLPLLNVSNRTKATSVRQQFYSGNYALSINVNVYVYVGLYDQSLPSNFRSQPEFYGSGQLCDGWSLSSTLSDEPRTSGGICLQYLAAYAPLERNDENKN
jgi:hypothetical protein